MASLIEELVSVMRSEENIYMDLIPIAEQKTKIIIENDLQSLQEVTGKEQLIIERINVLERKREEVITNISVVLNRKPEELTMISLIEMLKSQPEEQRQLSMVHESLKAAINRLIVINNQNKSLIQQSLEMIEFNMNLIQSTRMSPGNNNYTKGASQYEMEAARTGMFDAKQ